MDSNLFLAYGLLRWPTPVVLIVLLLSSISGTDAQPRCGTYLLTSSQALHKTVNARQSTASFQIGDPLTVPAFSFRQGLRYQTTTTCRWVGEHCYIFVEDEIWKTPRITQKGIESLAVAFDQSTPIHADQGIYQTTTGIFGMPPDVDGDPRIFIVVLDIIDSVISGTFSGYYDTENQQPPISREIVYVDSNPIDLDSNLARATLAHEFQHMLHWAADPDENKWLDEGCSEYAELACGYKDTTATSASGYLQVPNLLRTSDPSLLIGSSTGISSEASWGSNGFFLPILFDQSFLLVTYIAEQYGHPAIGSLVADPENGTASVDNMLGGLEYEERFWDVWGNWISAVFLDQEEGELGFRQLDVGKVRRDTLGVPSDMQTYSLQLWGVDYFVTDGEAGVAGLSADVSSQSDLMAVIINSVEGGYTSSAITIPGGSVRRIGSYGPGHRVLAFTRTSDRSEVYSFTLSPMEGTTPAACDFDASGLVDLSDFIEFVSIFGKAANQPGYDSSMDLNGGGSVDFADFLIFASNFGTFP
ncbi:MAG: hypothetical protein CME25_02055 [Gemmatimonadetes bacterium]|nr:hypothetical protein [Gemmatimonadota bacterium]